MAAIAVPLAIVSFRDANRYVFYPAALIAFASSLGSVMFAECVVRLTLRRRLALLAEADEPDPTFDGVSPVNWWSMLRAGFESVSYQSPHRHPELPLEGNPWRVLEKGACEFLLYVRVLENWKKESIKYFPSTAFGLRHTRCCSKQPGMPTHPIV